MASVISIPGAMYPSQRNGQPGPYLIGGNLYVVMLIASDSSPYSLGVFRSVDSGNTWVNIDSGNNKVIYTNTAFEDLANGTDDRTFAACLHSDGVSILVAYRNPGTQALVVSKFSTSSNTWVATSVDGPISNLVDPTSATYYYYQASYFVEMSPTSGKIYVLSVLNYDTAQPPNVPPLLCSRVYFSILTGDVAAGTWNAGTRVPNQTLNPSTGETTPPSYYPYGMVRGSSGQVHALVAMQKDQDTFSITPPGICYYRVDNGSGSADAAVVTVTASGQTWPPRDDNPMTSSSPGFGTWDNGAGALGLIFSYGIDTGLGTVQRQLAYAPSDAGVPSWSVVTIDTVTLTVGAYPLSWGIGQDGTTAVISYGLGIDGTVPNQLVQRTWNGTSLSAETVVFTQSVLGDEWFRQPSVVHTSSVGSVSGTTFGAGLSGLLAVLFFGAGSPPVTVPITPPAYGSKIILECPNYYDLCLDDANDHVRMLRGAGNLPEIPSCFGQPEEPYTIIPTYGDEWRVMFALDLPGVENVNTFLGTYRVPTGYNGIMWGILTTYTGTGFVQGSGDIQFRFKDNNRWIKGLGNLTLSLGSLTGDFFPLHEHERIYTGQYLSCYVSLGTGALGRLSGGKILMGMNGWTYPIQKRRYS